MSRRAIPGSKLAPTLIPIPAVTVHELNDAEDAADPMPQNTVAEAKGRFGSVWTALDAQDSAATFRAFDDAVKAPAARE